MWEKGRGRQRDHCIMMGEMMSALAVRTERKQDTNGDKAAGITRRPYLEKDKRGDTWVDT